MLGGHGDMDGMIRGIYDWDILCTLWNCQWINKNNSFGKAIIWKIWSRKSLGTWCYSFNCGNADYSFVLPPIFVTVSWIFI